MRPLLAAAAAATIAVLASGPAAAQAPQGRLNVVGRGVVERPPDQATVQIGVTTRAPTPAAAIDTNSAAAARLVAFARQFGVESRDIRTSSVNISENVRSVPEPGGRGRQEPDGYTATNTVAVVIRDLPRLGVFLREAITEGANRVHGVSFGLNDLREPGDAARQAAVEDGMRKAELLAAAANVKLGRLLRIDSPPRADRGGGAAEGSMRAMRAAPVPVESGAIEITAEVDLSFATE